jgi:hypothetical protein
MKILTDINDRPSDKEIREEIITELRKYTCSESEAIDMFEWIEEQGWQNYDGIDRWVKGRKVVETNKLYEIYGSHKS